MPTLQEMNERMKAWQNEKQGFSGGNELRLFANNVIGDKVVFNFVGDGKDDTFIKPYKAHVIKSKTTTGKDVTIHKYCSIQNGDREIECPYCAQGHTDIKPRFSMWMFVLHHLHAQLPAEKTFPPVNYNGVILYDEEVNDFKIWHTSGWSESPWKDISWLGENYGGLHNFTAQLEATGENLKRRYKIHALPNSPALSPEIYQSATEACTPIQELLFSQLATPVSVNPQATQAAAVPNTPAFSPPSAPTAAPAFVFGGNAPIAPAFNPIAGTAAAVESPVVAETETNTAAPTETSEETRRPLKKMF